MKIASVNSTIVAVPLTSRPVESRLHEGPRDLASILVEVHTNEGLVGLGEAAPVLGPDLTPAILNSAAELLVGENPLHVNRLMKTLYARYNLTHLHPHAANWALNALEMALWDLIGKSAGLPLYELWGGPFRLDIKYYGDIERQNPSAMEGDATRLVAAGFDTLYTKVGLDPE